MGFSHFLIGSVLFAAVLEVEGQTGTLTISADRPCVGGSLTLTCVQNGTFPSGAGVYVAFHKEQDETRTACKVNTSLSCSATFPSGLECGCVSSNGDEKVHEYVISNASKNEEIFWRCTRGAWPVSETVRSQDLIPDIAEGPTITSGSLTLRNTGSSLQCSGPSSMGDATLVITRNDTGEALGNASSTTLTVPVPAITGADNVTFTCSLGGRGARCSSVTPGMVVVAATIQQSSEKQVIYAKNGTNASISMKAHKSERVTWSRPGVSKRVPDGVDTVIETLTFTASKADGIKQPIQAQAGNSKQDYILVVDDYPPETPVGLAAGVGSSFGVAGILVIYVYIRKGKEKRKKKKEESSQPAPSEKGSLFEKWWMILILVFIGATNLLALAVLVVFSIYSESLTEAFRSALIAGWFFVALCLFVLVLGLLWLVKGKWRSEKPSPSYENGNKQTPLNETNPQRGNQPPPNENGNKQTPL